MDQMRSLLERAARRWEVNQELAQSMEQDEIIRCVGCPVITISRQMGSGGASIGRLVANQLNYKYYDRELIEQIAAMTGSDAEHIERHEVEDRSALSSMLLSLLDRRHVQDTVYLRSLLKVLRSIGKEGRAVIIGRGGSCVLHDALRIRFVAPFELRVERTAKVRDMTDDEARRYVLETDHRQRSFLRGFFGCDADNPELYDLVINTEHLSLEHGAELVITRLTQTWKDEV